VFFFLEMNETRQDQRNQAHDVSPTGGYENEDASRETGGVFIFYRCTKRGKINEIKVTM
jgi:hypothetical protein